MNKSISKRERIIMLIKLFAPRREIGLVTASLLFACFIVQGQQEKRIVSAQQENAAKLRQYSWKSRVEVSKDGETKSSQLYQVRYNAEGMPQQVLISGTSQKLPTSGLRGLIAKKKKEGFVEMLDGLGTLAKAYSKLPSDRMQHFMTNGTVIPELTPQQSFIRIQGRNVLQQGDSMTIWIDMNTHRQCKVEIQTTFDKRSVRIVSEFQDLPDGATYMSRSVIEYPNQKLTVTTENFDYKLEGNSR